MSSASPAPKATKASTGKAKKSVPKAAKETQSIAPEAEIAIAAAAPAGQASDAPVAEAVAVAAPSIDSFIAEMNENNQSIEKALRANKLLVKKLQQLHNKEIKQAAVALKSGRRKRERDPNAPKRKPSGIAKPSKISPELASFLKVDPEVHLARTDVIAQIAKYIKANNLENPTNRREIIPDKDLSKLLGMEKGHKEKITYFNLQRYMKQHFPKAAVVTA